MAREGNDRRFMLKLVDTQCADCAAIVRVLIGRQIKLPAKPGWSATAADRRAQRDCLFVPCRYRRRQTL